MTESLGVSVDEVTSNITIALRTRFGQSGQHEDLEEAISSDREAPEVLPVTHPDRSTSLNNIALALSTRFDKYGRQEDLEEGISWHREALELRPAPHPERSSSLNNIALALWTQFQYSRQEERGGGNFMASRSSRAATCTTS
ncbi:hypothetical protein JB92DRAFT_3121465 [Gautieria morchelliformis]|nr:hypothetical protein JB92DRAFT_3121465 [Gautieria morchelliformis]